MLGSLPVPLSNVHANLHRVEWFHHTVLYLVAIKVLRSHSAVAKGDQGSGVEASFTSHSLSFDLGFIWKSHELIG